MSGNLFLNAEKELQRLESMLQTLKRHNLTITKDRIGGLNGKPSTDLYNASMTFIRRDSTTGYFNVDGDSFPDLFQKISDKLQTP